VAIEKEKSDAKHFFIQGQTMNPRLTDLWVYLAASPLLGLTLTLLAYQVALWFHQRCRFHPLANPVLVAIALVSAVLLATDMDYPQYFDGAIPLYAQWSRLQAMATPLLIALVVGCLTAVISAWAVGAALGASHASLMSLAPKSVTTPIAMAVAQTLGGLPALAAALVVLSGVFGAIFAPSLCQLLGIQDDAVRGFAIGLAAHGIGTARAFQISEQAGAFAALGMGLNGVLTALALPWLMPWLNTLLPGT
jgi:putative effector of murein hydrolase